jgi:hypothetical protein
LPPLSPRAASVYNRGASIHWAAGPGAHPTPIRGDASHDGSIRQYFPAAVS